MFRVMQVHHATADSILLKISNSTSDGFAKLTKETLGGDALASRLLKAFATRDVVRVAPRRQRDEEGYLTVAVALDEFWSGVLCYPAATAKVLRLLFRVHQLLEIGSVVTGRVTKVTPKGSLLQVKNFTAVAPLEQLSAETGTSVACRVLSVDGVTGGVTVTANTGVVGRAPTTPEQLADCLRSFQQSGITVVEAEVLLSDDGAGCAVVEIRPDPSSSVSVIGHLVYSSTKAPRLAIHGKVQVHIVFAPASSSLAAVFPSLVVTLADSETTRSATVPLIRSTEPLTAMHAPFPWRDPTVRSKNALNGDALDDEAAKGLRKRAREEAIDRFEREGSSAVPKSPEEFQKLLLGNPNSSYLWTQFMAFHVGLEQYEEARLVAEKALKTIGVRETQELLNIWVAYMNLENTHGTAESLASTFRRALQYSDDEAVTHEKLADIFAASKKFEQLIGLCRVMTSKYRNVPRMWERLGTALIHSDKRDQLKRMIKEMDGALSRHEQCLVVEHLAIHEYRNGSVANGRGLFEALVAKVPKQSDVWSAYLDQELALLTRKNNHANVSGTRTIFERVSTLNFSAKVMQQFFTRFLTFEQTHGTPQLVEKVKERARAFVESKIAAVANAAQP